MNNESWYDAKLSDMDVARIHDSDDFVVDYDKSRGMYRVTIFKDGHFWDEVWFDEYKEQILFNADGLSSTVNKINRDILSGKGLSKL